MKKELDLKAILKKSIYEAQKVHGLLKEESPEKGKTSSDHTRAELGKKASTQEVASKRMPTVQLESETWGKKGSLEGSAAAMESYMAALRGGAEAATPEQVKKFLINLNRALGIKVGSEGQVKYDTKVSDTGLPQIISGLVIRQALFSMIHHNKAGTSGDIWEGFVARMFGKSLSQDKPIEDIAEKDSKGNLISLKLIGRTTKIEGSRLNLAKALVKEGVNGVTYLIGEKSKEDNPFRVKFYSFTITKDNFFHIEYGRNPLTVDIIKERIEVWNKTFKLGLNTALVAPQPAQQPGEEAPDFGDLIDADRTNLKGDQQYFDYIFKKAKDPELIAAANHLADAVEGLSSDDKLLLTNYLKRNETIVKILKDKRVEKIAAAFFKSGNLENLGPDIFKSPMHTAIVSLLQDYSEASDDAQLKRIKDVLNAIDSINVIFKDKKKEVVGKIRSYVTAKHQKSTTVDVKALIVAFWDAIASRTWTDKDTVGSFKLEPSAIKNMHYVEVDEEYEPIYLLEDKLFISAQNIANLFETYAQPIYDDHYQADLAIRNYFVDDNPSGMTDLEKILGQTVKDINTLRGGTSGEFKKASELTENKKAFKKPTVDDILDEL